MKPNKYFQNCSYAGFKARKPFQGLPLENLMIIGFSVSQYLGGAPLQGSGLLG